MALAVVVVVFLGAATLLSDADGVTEQVNPATTLARAQPTISASEPDGPLGTDTTPAATGPGTPAEPYRVDEPFEVRYQDTDVAAERTWRIEVTGPATPRTADVVAANQFNQPPPEGEEFVLVPLRLEYVDGPTSGSLFDLNFKAVTDTGVTLTTFDPSCGVLPDGIDTLQELSPGEVVEGTICWVVAEGDLDGLLLSIEVFLNEGETYVDIGPQ